MCIRSFAFASAIFGGICLAQSAAPPTQPLPAPSPQAPASAAASQPASQSEMSTHDAPAAFNTRVFLVQVPVVVRDKQGHAIGTLHKEDFQLFDKGKPQIITRFTVEKAGASSIPAVKALDAALPQGAEGEGEGAPIPEHFIAYLFDDVHLAAGDIARMRLATEQHLDQTYGPHYPRGDFHHFGRRSAGLHQRPQHDPRSAEPDSALYTDADLARRLSPNVSLYMADLVINKQDPTAIAAAVADATADAAASPPACLRSTGALPRSRLSR